MNPSINQSHLQAEHRIAQLWAEAEQRRQTAQLRTKRQSLARPLLRFWSWRWRLV